MSLEEMSEWFLDNYEPCYGTNEYLEDVCLDATDILTSEFGDDSNEKTIEALAKSLEEKAGTIMWMKISSHVANVGFRCAQTSNRKLCQTFQRLSARTWRDVCDGADLKISEETITDNLLLYLSRHHKADVKAVKFSKKEEGQRTGADWEWWFVKGNAGFPMRVQAKKIDVVSQNYQGLLKKVPNNSQLQVDLLLEDAKRRNLFPVYCFYSYCSKNSPTFWSCSGRPYRQELLGCTIADAYAVKAQISLRRIGVTDLSKIWQPWHCLVCCDSNDTPGESLPTRVKNLFTRDSARETVPDVRQIPEYVARIRDIEHELPADQSAIDGIDGVVVIVDPTVG